MPLLERVRIELYIPDLPTPEYQDLLSSLEAEFTYAFGGSTVVRSLEGNYLSVSGDRVRDRINLIYSDVPLALSTDYVNLATYTSELRRAAREVLTEEAVLVSVEQVYHAV